LEKLRTTPITIVGVGAVGRQVALQLAVMGAERVTLIDPDVVEEVNFGSQGYRTNQLNLSKVTATWEDVCTIQPVNQWDTSPQRFKRGKPRTPIIFCCVDNMSSRSLMYDCLKNEINYFGDVRMGPENIRLLCAYNLESWEHYGTTLYSDEEARPNRCTAGMTYYGACIAAGKAVAMMVQWLRGQTPPWDVLDVVNLWRMETLT
jgi:sulfur carrier protein ThiS adenylyltransferase